MNPAPTSVLRLASSVLLVLLSACTQQAPTSSTPATPDAGATGTPAFAAPEQLLGETQGSTVDLFAVAGIVAFALTGQPPFPGGDASSILAQQLANPFDDSRFPEPVGAWLKRGLASDPLQRFHDAAVMQLAWREVVSAVDRESRRSESWWSRFGVMGQGQRG